MALVPGRIMVQMPISHQLEFMKETGFKLKGVERGHSLAAAVIANIDWALEYPQPIPPRVHVSCAS